MCALVRNIYGTDVHLHVHCTGILAVYMYVCICACLFVCVCVCLCVSMPVCVYVGTASFFWLVVLLKVVPRVLLLRFKEVSFGEAG